MVAHDHDVSRFADRSRELWSERTMSEVKYKQNSFLQCCGNCPFASLLAFLFTLTGTGICCGCLYYPLRVTIEQINNAFQIEYIDNDWIRILRLAAIFVLAIMGGFSLILLIVGSLATGATRHQVYTGFRSRLGGRIATGFFSVIVYGLLLIWLFAMLALVIPCVGLYILKYRCIEAWGTPTASGWPNTASPVLCLTPGTYGIPVPREKPDVKVCQQRFNELCTLTEHTPRYFAALVGSFFVVIGLIHFLCCLVANYAHIKDGRKLHDYEEAIREEIETSKLNQDFQIGSIRLNPSRMFEAIIASLLKGYVARYVDINADQLSVQLLYGRPIVVENLTFNKIALNNDIRTKLKLPIEIESLHVGKIQCSFVWSSLFFRSSSAAFIIKIEHVRAIIKPIVLDDSENSSSSDDLIEENEIVKKQNRLDLSEQQLEKEFEFLGEVKSSSWSIKRLILSFLEKIQIQIIDVDIGYESFTSDNNPYIVGLKFDNIQISNELSNENMNKKNFQIQNLGLYVDSNPTKDNLSTHSYILLPSNLIKIYLTHNYLRSALINRRQARYELEWTFDDLNLKSSTEQIRILSDVIRFIQYSNTHRKFITDPSRPDSKISKQSAKSWWRYITLVIIRTQNYLKTPISNDQTHTTTNFWFNSNILNKRLKQLVTYKHLYRLYLDNKYLKRSINFTPEDRLIMNEIELDFDLDCLIRIRRVIFRKRANEQFSLVNNNTNTQPTSSWYMSYAKWISSKSVDLWKTTSTDVNNQTTISNSQSNPSLNENDKKLQEQVSNFIAQSLEDQDLSQHRRDALYLRLKFTLKSVQIDLINDKDILFNFSLNNVSVLTELRPKYQSILFYLRLDDLNICDKLRTDAFSNIVCPKQRSQESLIGAQRAPVFEISYETNPPAQQPKTKRLSFSIAIRSRGLCFVCCPISVERLRNFFSSAVIQPSSIPSTSSSSPSILQHWTQLKDRTTKQLKSAFEQIFSTSTMTKMTSSNVKHIKQGQRRYKKKFDIYLDICAPQMIIPQSSNRALIIDFGYLTFINDEYRQSSCPLKNCDMHNTGTTSPSSLTDYFQQRPYFFNEQRTSPLPSTVDDDEEFLTPDSSPLATDGILENETVNYPVNIIPREQSLSPTNYDEKNLMYSSFSLSLCDMQIGYINYSDNQLISAIIEKFGVCFLIQYRTIQVFDPLWPLVKVSGTLPKIIIHLDPSRIETLCETMNNWSEFIENLTTSLVSTSDLTNLNKNSLDAINARLAIGFRINEISVQLSDDLRALCEIRIENIDLTLMNHIHSNILSFSVHTLMIVDALQNHGKDYELLLTSNHALDINTQTGILYESEKISSNNHNEYLIRIDIQSSKDIQTNENCLNIDIHVNKLHFVFNPETLSILINFTVNIIYRIKNIFQINLKKQNDIQPIVEQKKITRIQINSEFQELSILFTNIFTIQSTGKRILGNKIEKIAAARIKHASLKIFIEPSTLIEAEICSLQIFNLLKNPLTITHNEQSSAIIDLGTEEKSFDQNDILPSKAFHLIYTRKKDDLNNNNEIEDLLIEMASVCYTHSPKIIYKIEKILKYMAQHCHSTAAIQMEKMKQNMIKQGSMLINQYVLPTESVLQNEESTRQLNLSIVLATPILVFRPQSKLASKNARLVIHLGDIHVENSENHPSNYEIKINDLNLFSIDLEHEFRHNQGLNLINMYKNPHYSLPILDNISIHLDLKLTDTSTAIDSKLVSSVQMFLGKHQITLLQNIISSLTYNDNDEIDATSANKVSDENTDEELLLYDQEEIIFSTDEKKSLNQFNKFSMHFQLPELILAFQGDFELKPTTVCEAIFGQFQMSIEQQDQYCKTILLRLNSLHINDHLIKTDQSLFSTRCRKNSSSTYRNDHLISSSCPTENYPMHDTFLSSSVPAYMVSNDSSTWTLIPSTPIRTVSPSPPAFIDINITLMDKKHPQYDGFKITADAQFGEVNINFVISTWVTLFDIIGLIGGTPLIVPTDARETKEFPPTSDTDYMQINIHIDAVSCHLSDDYILPIRILLQRFDCQIQNFLTIEKAIKTLIINGKLGSVSIYDLSSFGKLYDERFCTSGTNALVFTYTKEEDLIPISSSNFPSRLQLYLRMTSVQYIHTQRFLMDLIHFFDQFHQKQDFYNRVRSAAAGQTISYTAGRSTGIELDIEAESPILILPQYALDESVIILHLGHIIIKNRFLYENQPGTLSSIMNKSLPSNCLLDVISIQFQDTLLYSANYCKLDSNIKSTVQFTNFGFYIKNQDFSSMLRERCYLNIQIERNLDNSLDHSSPTYSLKADLSSIDILLDTHQYALVRGILAYNIGEQLEQPTRAAMMVDDPLCVSTVLTGDVYLDMNFIIQMDNVGFEIFILNKTTRSSLGYCAFRKSNFSFEKYSNNNQVLDLTCTSIKLVDTRTDTENQFRDILTSSSSMSKSTSNMQLEIHLLTTKTDDKYTIVLNHTRIIFIIDWLFKLKDYLNSFQQILIPKINQPIQPIQIKKLFELRLNINQSELVLVQTTTNQQSNALVLSGIMTLTYRESIDHRPLDCTLFSVTLFSCQMNNIQSTAVSIIEPINITFNIHLSKDKQQRIFEINLPQLFIRLSYSDVKLMIYMFQSISKQFQFAQSREIIPKYQINQPIKYPSIDNELLTEYCPQDNQIDFRIRSTIASNIGERERRVSIDDRTNDKVSKLFLNIHSIKFSCEQISLCLIDDCLNANIPLLNINLKLIKLILIEYETHRLHQIDLQLNIDYYNRLLSGYEPFIELWPLQLTLKISNNFISLILSSNHVLNINYTKTMHQLYDLVKNNWLQDYYNTNDLIKENMYFRRPKPFEPYCFKNLVGQRVKFRTWLSSQQKFDPYDHIVEHNEIKSFIFPIESSTTKVIQTTAAAATTSSSYSDRRLLISIEGWEWLTPISIDRVGTFFRLALPTGDRLQKPVLVFIDVTMTDSSMRSITIRSAIEIRNQLLTSIDMRLKCGSGSLHDIRLEPNEVRSLPLQFCPTLRQFQVRPADFSFNYCGEPVNWMEIANEQRPRGGQQQQHPEDETNENTSLIESDSIQRHRDINSTDRLSFFRTCSMSGNEALYFVCVQSKRTRLLAYKDYLLSSYQLSILSPLIINNLLPCDLFFQIYPYPQRVRLNPYKSHREHTLNIGEAIDIVFTTDLYHMSKPLHVPSINDLNLMKYHHQRVAFYDSIDRMLLVDVTIVCSIRYRLKISVSVPYVLLNKSGIPLVFKQEGAVNESAGQAHEHELARNREPLLFSFSDQEASHACVMRIGTGLHKNDDGRPSWSQRFTLERGSSYRQLYVRSPHGFPDWIYYIGIDVRQGKGRLRRTNFIFLSTRYMISNQSSYDLSIAQRHIVRAMLQTGYHGDYEQKCLHVLKHSNVAYHWPRSDLDQLLCVRVINNLQYRHVYWSGGFLIDRVNAFHINLRYDNNQCLILRVQVIERGGTYFVVFMDSNQMPAPLRIKNLSDVPIQFYQSETREELTYLRAFIQPHQSMDYAWDEPTLRQAITCSVLGGTKETYDLQRLGQGENLCYENHICLGLEQTFKEEITKQNSSKKSRNSFQFLSQQLVIDYIQNTLMLAFREENKRSQLWRMTSAGLLVHTGSSSPRDWSNKNDTSDDIRQAYVLDIDDTSHNTNSKTDYLRLTIRRYDPKRELTQTWKFHHDGYLCMGETQMCVQVFGELKEKSVLVLGPIRMNEQGKVLPALPTMHIRPHRRLKGSGLLSVRTYADGPTRVLEITDVKTSNSSDSLKSEILTTPIETSITDHISSVIYHLDVRLDSGIGISIINSVGRESEELVYILINSIRLLYKDENNAYSIDGTIGAVIISNQLLITSTPCLLYATYAEDTLPHSAVRLQATLQKASTTYKQLHIFQYLSVGLNSIIIQIDEILLWKLVEFFGIGFSSSSSLSSSSDNKTSKTDDQTYDLDEGEYDTQRLLSLLTSTQATRIYFNEFSISSIDLNLSVYCGNARSLPAHLLTIKRHAPFPLIRFENAQIHLKSYDHTHIFNTYDFFLLALTTHYVEELKRQAFRILGSVDFLGNPLGLFNDVTGGIASLADGSVTGLVKNVAHGVADSTSKFTGTLSYGLGKLTLDEDHDDMREAIANNYRGSSVGHVIGGTVGLAAGFIGGLTSMITQPYKSVVEDGVSGLVKGFAKGIVGTVSKPVVGVLDFANGLALAIKEGSRSSNSILRSRTRTTRCPTNIQGLLQPYSIYDSDGQCLLYQMNKRDLTEKYITRITLSQTPANSLSKRRLDHNYNDEYAPDRRSCCVHAMITSQRIIVYRTDTMQDEFDYEVTHAYDFSSIANVVIIEDEQRRPYIQFLLHDQARHPNRMTKITTTNVNQHQHQHPIFRCDLHDRATRLTRDIHRAKEIFEEEKLTYIPPDDNDDDDDDDDDNNTNNDMSGEQQTDGKVNHQ